MTQQLFGRTPWAAPRAESDSPEWRDGVRGAATPPSPTLQDVRLAKALLEGDILALVRRFEEVQGVGVESVEVQRTDVSRVGHVSVILERL